MTKVEQNQRLVQEYREAGNSWPVPLKIVAEWLIDRGFSKSHKVRMIQEIAEDLAKALAVETYVDPQGRTVRCKLPFPKKVDGKQTSLWDDIRTISEENAHLWVRHRRGEFVGEGKQIQLVIDSFNDNRKPEVPLQFEFNLWPDILEEKALDALDQVA